jgi:hypothetical protein
LFVADINFEVDVIEVSEVCLRAEMIAHKYFCLFAGGTVLSE